MKQRYKNTAHAFRKSSNMGMIGNFKSWRSSNKVKIVIFEEAARNL